ncbi:MAG: hypothetical protein JXA54_09180 [Candidatus Heimdallarchaeota archaeon]|nr:hypothetical protein [Candidatus Heimdallarchaeota archaeon]
MNLIKIQRTIYLTTFVCNILFLILTTVAMLVYPGGIESDPSTIGYLFFKNFFSDLGRINTFSGASNSLGRLLFVLALTIEGISLLAYFLFVLPLFNENKKTIWLSRFGTLSGIVAALGFVLLGFVSLDLNAIAHGTFTFIAFIGTFIALIFYLAAIFHSSSYPNVYAWLFLICSFLSLVYIVILFGGGSSGPLSNLILQAISQKIIVYIQIVIFAIQALASYFVLRKKSIEITIY